MKWLKANNKKEDGHWEYSYRFAELQIASEYKLKPSEWDEASMEDKEEMFAFWKNKREMESWENYLQEQKIEKMKRDNKKR